MDDDDDPGPDSFFTAEFKKGDLANRLWRGGLRASPTGYTVAKPVHVLSASIAAGLDITGSEKATALVDAIESLWNDTARLRRACDPLQGAHVAHELNPTSLARVLLCVEPLQAGLAQGVVNKLSEFGEGDGAREGGLAPLLLAQLKWLDFLVDSPALCESLLSIVAIVSPQMQRSIVEGLPEILDDRSRDTAVAELIRILEENPALMGSVVDALGALGVSPAAVQDVSAVVLATLSAANPDMLPASLRYLMRTAPPTLLDATLAAMRVTLAHAGLGLGPGRLCLDALRAGFRIGKGIADHAVKTLRRLEHRRDHRAADIWIILALLDSPAHRKQAETLFRKKAAANAFSFAVLDAALAPFADSFVDLHDRLICLAAITIKAPEPTARKTGIGLYAMLFRLFKLGNARRNTISALLEHTGSRRPNEVDSALEALVQIARESESSRSLLPHTASIQGLLDFLETFSDSQLRQIWALLALLCRSTIAKAKKGADGKKRAGRNQGAVICDSENEDEDEDEDDEEDDLFGDAGNQSELSMLEILIRKELTHVDMAYRRIGVLGACTMIKILGSHMRSNLFQMLFDAGKSQSFTQALAFDELANVLPKGKEVEKSSIAHISDKIAGSFEATYLGDTTVPEDKIEIEGAPESILWANFDGPDVEVCIPIYRLILQRGSSFQGSLDIVRPLAPGLRLLCILTSMRDNGFLDEVDAVIGAPLRMPNITDPAQFMSLTFVFKKSVLLSFFAAHSWIIELINGFSGQSSPELRAKCIRRLENLIELEEIISHCTSRFPMWTNVLYDAYQSVESLRDHAASTEKASGRGRKSASSATDASDGPGTKTNWKSCARALDPCALALLRVTSPITYTSTDFETEQVGNTVKTVKQKKELDGKGLHYLLQQLMQTIVANIRDDIARASGKNVSLAFLSLQVGGAVGGRKPSTNGAGSHGGSAAAVNPLDALKELKPAITSLAAQLSRSLKRSMGEGDIDGDADDFTAMKLFKESAITCLKCLAGILSSHNLKDTSAQEFLFNILASVRFDGQQALPSDPLTETDIFLVAKTAFGSLRKKFAELSNSNGAIAEDGHPEDDCLENLGMEGAAAFLGAMESVYAYCSELDRNALGVRLGDMAGSVLERRWGDTVMKSKRTLKLLPGIVRMYVQCSSEPMDVVSELRERLTAFENRLKTLRQKSVESQELDQGPDGNSTQDRRIKNWGSLCLPSYHVYCISVLEEYIVLFKKFKPSSYDSSEEAFGKLVQFITGTMPLFDLGRNNEKVLGAAMRAGRAFVEQFIKTCLPFLKEKFTSYRRIVLRILKVQQKFTRMLQVFCSHSKSLRDTGLTALVPPLRRSLELLLYRVKEMLQSHDETGAYTLGNLKHRDINGAVVSSQDQYRSESEMSDSDVDEDEGNAEEKEKSLEKENGKRAKVVAASAQPKSASAQPKSAQRVRRGALLSNKSKSSQPQKSMTTLDISLATTIARPKSSGSKHTTASKRSGTKRRSSAATMSDSGLDGEEEDEDEDLPLVHSLLPPNAGEGNEAKDTENEYTPIIPGRKRKQRRDGAMREEEPDVQRTPMLQTKKRKKKRTPDSTGTRKAKVRAVRALIDDEADVAEDEDELDENDSLDGFLVDSQANESQL